MGAFKNPKFVKEFAYRTKINYYNMRKNEEGDVKERQRIENEILFLEHEMSEKEFEIADFYEITQLINSILGLLIFPQQEYFNDIGERGDIISAENFPTLYRCISKDDYENGYKTKTHVGLSVPDFACVPNELKTPGNIFRHLRNAIAHENVMIHPLGNTNEEGQCKITDIVFEDVGYYVWNGRKWALKTKHVDGCEEVRFKMSVNTEENESELEKLLMEICNYILAIDGE